MAATPYQSEYPLAAPTITGNDITLDVMLNQPTRITKYLSDITLTNYFASRLFPTTGGVSGGAVIYDQITLNDIYETTDVQYVGPGDQFPVMSGSFVPPKVAVPVKFGGKYFITDEARDRNDPAIIQREGLRIMNTIYRKLDDRAVAVLNATLSQLPSQTITGNNWTSVITNGVNTSTNTLWPAADFAKVQLAADVQELGYSPNLWIVNPAQKSVFYTIYGQYADQVLESHGVTMFASNRVPAGTAFVAVQGAVGETRLEKPLTTETWREQERQITWVQSDVRPVSFVTDPYAVFKVQGLAG